MQDFEKLGSFYLGRNYDIKNGQVQEPLLLYDARDLVTHGVCVGMTGSGKTGLCVGLLEEAAIDNVPALVIDPKGDLANLMLLFPKLRAEDFVPWVQEESASRKGLSREEFASQQASLWKKGLADWQQTGKRIQRLKDSAEFAVYTPGSSAGIPVSILKSFAAPAESLRRDADLLRERVGTTTTSLLGLLGIDADPIQSREHILISNILNFEWSETRDVDLGRLIQLLQQPPMSRIGVMDLESIYPAKDRFALAMRLNNLLAAPGFTTWMQGEALDIRRFLYTEEGRARVSIFSIAHLSDAERMFFVSLLLNETLGWMRTQSGTSSLRALLYMDEIAGYLPPTANPPSKAPLLTMMKQARAYGFGVLLSTQNPVDLDYKALSNAGTWFIGRLQTERDKARLLDGLESIRSANGPSRKELERLISNLDKRVFLLHNVHEDGPAVFHTRWVMSYLRGPMTREEIKQLMDPVKVSRPPLSPQTPATSNGGSSVDEASWHSEPPVVANDVPCVYLSCQTQSPDGARLFYRPLLAAKAGVDYVQAKSGIDHHMDFAFLAEFDKGSIDWEGALWETPLSGFLDEPEGEAGFAEIPAAAARAKSYRTWERQLKDWIYRQRHLEIYRCREFKAYSRAEESEGEFRVRLREMAREKRDLHKEKIRSKYAARVAKQEERIRRYSQAVEREKEQARTQKTQTVISFGAALLSSFLGRKKVSVGTLGRATTAMRGAGRARKEAMDVARAKENLEVATAKLVELEEALERDLGELSRQYEPENLDVTTISVRPKKMNIAVEAMTLAWVPHWKLPSGRTQLALGAG